MGSFPVIVPGSFNNLVLCKEIHLCIVYVHHCSIMTAPVQIFCSVSVFNALFSNPAISGVWCSSV